MSPPQVNLSEKRPPVVSEDEIPVEKTEKYGNFAIVTVETEQIRCDRQSFQVRRRRRIVCCGVLIVLVVILAAASTAVALKMRHHHRRHHHFGNDGIMMPDGPEEHDRDRWSCLYGRDRLNENVWVDRQQQLIHAIHEHGNNNQPSIHVLHEYKRRMAAYKDVDENVCYITRLDETFEQGYVRWESYERVGREPKTLRVLTRQRINVLVMEHVTDIHIAAHCKNAISFWAVEIREEDVTAIMTTVNV